MRRFTTGVGGRWGDLQQGQETGEEIYNRGRRQVRRFTTGMEAGKEVYNRGRRQVRRFTTGAGGM